MEFPLALAEQVAAALKARGETVGVAESSAGGLISAALLAVPGASAYFVGAGVVYTRKSLLAFTALGEEALGNAKPGSEASALDRARAIRERLGTTWGLSETGVAGPTGSRYGYRPGHACVAVSGPVDAAHTVETGADDRLDNMYAFTSAALTLFLQVLARR